VWSGAALDLGINFFDTANVYGRPRPSTGLARRQPLKANPPSRSSAAPSSADVVIATKSGERQWSVAHRHRAGT
jgi:aryl-alcohol dehydrogenase-like predicted oxidoreductase